MAARLVPSKEPPVSVNNLVPGTTYDLFSPITSYGGLAARFTYLGPSERAGRIRVSDYLLPSGAYALRGNPETTVDTYPRDTIRPYYPPEARQKVKELRAMETAFEDPKSRLKNFPVGPDSVVASFLTGKKGSFQQQRHATEKAVGMEGPATKHGGRRRKTRRRKNRMKSAKGLHNR